MTPINPHKLNLAARRLNARSLPARYDDLSEAERVLVRTQYIWQQHGLCAHCAFLLDDDPAPNVSALPVDETKFPEGFFTHPIHLHHDHVTGLTIGAVHAYCNAVLWQYEGK